MIGMTSYPATISLRRKSIAWQMFLLDFLSIPIALLISYFFKMEIHSNVENLRPLISKVSILYAPLSLIYLSCLYIFDIYSLQLHKFRARFAIRLFEAVAMGTMLSTSLLFFVPSYIIGRGPLFYFSAAFFVLTLANHLAISSMRTSRQGAIVLLKENAEPYFEEFERELKDSICFKHKFVQKEDSFIDRNKGQVLMKDIIDLAAYPEIDIIVFSNPVTFDLGDFRQLLALRCPDKQIHEFNQMYSRVIGKIPIYKIEDYVGYSFASTSVLQSRVYLNFKRFTDLLLSGVLIVLLSPVFLICALAVKLDSPGTVFFVQERLGYKRRPIRVVKFRTMVKDAEKATGPVRQGQNDPRITRIGRFLRASKIDELPQLFNVFKGNLSFIGPRPVRQVFEDQCEKKIPLYFLRHMIKPGITGWAQVSTRLKDQRDEGWELERFQHDLYYLNHCSLGLDLLILYKTARVVLSKLMM